VLYVRAVLAAAGGLWARSRRRRLRDVWRAAVPAERRPAQRASPRERRPPTALARGRSHPADHAAGAYGMHHGNTEVRLTSHRATRCRASSRKRHYHAHLIVDLSCCIAYARHVGVLSLPVGIIGRRSGRGAV